MACTCMVCGIVVSSYGIVQSDRADETAASREVGSEWPFVRDTLTERITTTAAMIMLSCSAHNMPSSAGRGIVVATC
eukprot:364869-Chlamydomonas_euryale.AAC.24